MVIAAGGSAQATGKYAQTFGKATLSNQPTPAETAQPAPAPQPADAAPAQVDNGARFATVLNGGKMPATTVAPASTFTIYENFEGDWPSYWSLVDESSTDGGEYLWGKRTCYVFQGKYAAFSTGGGGKGSSRGCSSNYPVNALSTGVVGPFDLTQYVSGSLVYHFTGRSEYNGGGSCTNIDDILFVGAGISSDITTHYGFFSCGNFSDKHYQNQLDLTKIPLALFNSKNVYLSMEFASDGDSNRGVGFAVDYLALILETKPSGSPEVKVYVPMSRKYTAPSVISCPDGEPNDNKAQAKQITQFGVVCQGSLHQQRVDDTSDFYAVDVNANQKLTVDLSNFGKNDYDLYLYSATSDQALALSQNNTGLAEHLEYTSPSSQRLYIWVVGRDPFVSPYTYNLKVQG